MVVWFGNSSWHADGVDTTPSSQQVIDVPSSPQAGTASAVIRPDVADAP